MPKKQKTVSVPLAYYERLETFYEKNREILEFMEITSVAELLRLLANHGWQPLLKTLESLSQSRKMKSENLEAQ